MSNKDQVIAKDATLASKDELLATKEIILATKDMFLATKDMNLATKDNEAVFSYFYIPFTYCNKEGNVETYMRVF